GTVKYAPPEQMGELIDGKRVEPGSYSDVFAFGKLCCQALFGTTEPRSRQLDTLPKGLKQLLEDCIEHSLEHRHKNFAPVLEALRASGSRKPARSVKAKVLHDTEQPSGPPNPLLQYLMEDAEQALGECIWAILERTNGRPSTSDNTEVAQLLRQ